MNINLNDLKDSLEFTKISWDTTNEFNILISDLINRDLDIMGEADNVKIKFTKMDRLFFTNLDRII